MAYQTLVDPSYSIGAEFVNDTSAYTGRWRPYSSDHSEREYITTQSGDFIDLQP